MVDVRSILFLFHITAIFYFLTVVFHFCTVWNLVWPMLGQCYFCLIVTPIFYFLTVVFHFCVCLFTHLIKHGHSKTVWNLVWSMLFLFNCNSYILFLTVVFNFCVCLFTLLFKHCHSKSFLPVCLFPNKSARWWGTNIEYIVLVGTTIIAGPGDWIGRM